MNIIEEYSDLFKDSFNDVGNALEDYLFKFIEIDNFNREIIIKNLISVILDDVSALIKGDPAARQHEISDNFNDDPKRKDFHNVENIHYVIKAYKSLKAVIMYRVAHFIFEYCDLYLNPEEYEEENIRAIKPFLCTQARKLSEDAKVQTSVEIHPAAKIGKRFVIDHGYGTVIGETCEIGDDCYVLQGVTLGASNIKNNQTGRRHPKIGNKVQIAGCARIFGPISIGDEVVINGYAVVNQDIPPKSTVSIVNQIQLISPKKFQIFIYGIRPKDDGLEIIGRNLNLCENVELLNNEGQLLDSIIIKLVKDYETLFLKFENIDEFIHDPKIFSYLISLNLKEGNILLENSIGWNDFIKIKKGIL